MFANGVGAINIPLQNFLATSDRTTALETHLLPILQQAKSQEKLDVFVICNHGHRSRLAAHMFDKFVEARATDLPGLTVHHVAGGLQAWQEHIDTQFVVL